MSDLGYEITNCNKSKKIKPKVITYFLPFEIALTEAHAFSDGSFFCSDFDGSVSYSNQYEFE